MTRPSNPRRQSFLRRAFSSVAANNLQDASESHHHRHRGNGIPRSLSDTRDCVAPSRQYELGSGEFLNVYEEASAASDAATIDPHAQANAAKAADEKKSNFRESMPQSLREAHDYRDCIAPFRRDEVVFGSKLGSGEFSHVYEVQSFQLSETALIASGEELDRRLHLKKYEKYRETKNARYAVKHIKDDYHLRHSSDSFIQAAGDLALEAEFLASLQHPNIIKLRGISSLGAAGFMHGPSGYFLVIDRLNETLDQRLKKWRGPRDRQMSGFRKSVSSLPFKAFRRSTISQLDEMEDGTNEDEKMDERYNIALQISAALVYLHSHSIIFRDLKPANIGFDVRGDVKIFDFGLARVMPEDGCPNNDAFEMSGAGSPRYMAPECLSGKAYNLRAEVYSFSIILWEILTARTPYMFVRRRRQLINYVVEENGRPDIDESWPTSIRGMLESSFDSEIDKRPKMTLWYDIIRETLVTLRGGDRTGLRDACIRRRRTIESMSSASPSLGSKSRSSKDMSSSGSKTRDSKGTPPLSKEVRKKEHELHQQLDKLQKENSEIKAKLASVADDSEKLGGLKMELQMLEEERRREKSVLESAVDKTTEDHVLLLSERDAAKAQVRDLEQLLAAAQADLDLANTDRDRALMANENLQRALEDFQGERLEDVMEKANS